MRLGETVVDAARKRMNGRTEQVPRVTGRGGGIGGFIFGLLFVGAGTPIVLIGFKVIPVDPSTVHAPYMVIALIGAMFAGAGVMVWLSVLKGLLLHRKRSKLIAENPSVEAFKDYPWNPRGVSKSSWVRVRKSIGGVLFFALFLSPFNWWAWLSNDKSIGVKVIVSLFDLFLILALADLVRRILVAIKYGPSRLEYGAFPCTTGSCVSFRWFPPNGLEEATKMTFELRAVEEWTETSGSGKNSSTRVIHEQAWGSMRETEDAPRCRGGRPEEITFDVPADAPQTDLSAEGKVRYWELEVKAEAPGVDFSERYLVPVYALDQ